MEQLTQILERLNRAGVDYVLVGGMAAVLHGVPLVTRDVDVCLRLTKENLTRLHKALDGLHPVHRQTPQLLPFDAEVDFPRGLKNIYLRTDWGVLDCLGEIAGVGSFEDVIQRSMVVKLPIGPCRVLNLKAMIDAKSAMNRSHDKAALVHLRRIQKSKESGTTPGAEEDL